jgi:hypothetical protein
MEKDASGSFFTSQAKCSPFFAKGLEAPFSVFGVVEFAGAAVVVLGDHLRVGIGDEAFVPELLGHVEDVVDLDHAEMEVQALQAWKVRQRIGAPADITLTRALPSS